MEINDRELHQTMEEFLDENQNKRNIWNVATISGLIILFLVSTYMMQLVLGASWGPDLTGLINVLPVIGGVILIVVGVGYWVDNKRKKDSDMLKNDIERSGDPEKEAQKTDVGRSANRGGAASHEYFRAESKDAEKEGASYTGSATEHGSSSRIDSYGLKQPKKLYKSRTDKKLCGVCGGLATYFGMSSTVVRLIFVVLTLIGWGSAAILYLALCIALKKEPVEAMK